MAQPSRNGFKPQRVPFLADLLDPLLASSSPEDLEFMLTQLDGRHTAILQEMEVVRRLGDDLPGGSCANMLLQQG